MASAQNDLKLPLGLRKIIEFNKQSTADFAVKISFFVAFAAGIIGILSPCILPFLPAYLSYTFKEKKNITKATLIFFLGFSTVFVSMGAIAGFIGEQSLVAIQKEWLVAVAGAFMILLGIMSFFGKNVCSYIGAFSKYKNDIPGIFLFGASFAVGWTACLGPILAGILGIGAVLGNVGYSALLLFFYSLGNFVPLFILSVFYDKLNISKSRFIQGRIFTFNIMGKERSIHSTNLISGSLLILFGIFLLAYKNTALINTMDIFKTKSYFYSIQHMLIDWKYSNILGILIFLLFIIVIGILLFRHGRKRG